MPKVKNNTFQGTELVLLSILFVLLFVPSKYIEPLHSTVGKIVLLTFVVGTSYYFGKVSSIIAAFIVIIILNSSYEGHCNQTCNPDKEESETKLTKENLDLTTVDDEEEEEEEEDTDEEEVDESNEEENEGVQEI